MFLKGYKIILVYTFCLCSVVFHNFWTAYFCVPLGQFRIFTKIRGDIRESMFISGVNDTGNERGKFWGINFFHILLRVRATWVHFTFVDWIFAYFSFFSSRQAGIVSTVLSVVSLTPKKNLSALSLTPVNIFLAVSLTPAINFRLFGYFWLVSTTQGEHFFASDNER